MQICEDCLGSVGLTFGARHIDESRGLSWQVFLRLVAAWRSLREFGLGCWVVEYMKIGELNIHYLVWGSWTSRTPWLLLLEATYESGLVASGIWIYDFSSISQKSLSLCLPLALLHSPAPHPKNISLSTLSRWVSLNRGPILHILTRAWPLLLPFKTALWHKRWRLSFGPRCVDFWTRSKCKEKMHGGVKKCAS